jgi:hypothetical protein
MAVMKRMRSNTVTQRMWVEIHLAYIVAKCIQYVLNKNRRFLFHVLYERFFEVSYETQASASR